MELLVALYAVHRIGAAYLPIDPLLPTEWTREMIEDAQPVLTLDGEDVRRMSEQDGLAADGTEWPPPRPSNTAYFIYTSGSTGRPKGVAVSHEAIVNCLRWMQAEYPLGPDSSATPTEKTCPAGGGWWRCQARTKSFACRERTGTRCRCVRFTRPSRIRTAGVRAWRPRGR
ncbi:AMP-binding protein [Streptomyces tamarix]|uniref:AMP-binding protein n=1 Tax=Streptomyces tamarix TaxID=3078565 RepID=UPI003704C2AD